MRKQVHNRLAEIRKSRGIGAADLARSVQVSRQTIYAIEAGSYVPNTEVALRLAAQLEVTVDQLFSLPPDPPPTSQSLTAEVLSASPAAPDQPVRICRIGTHWVGIPASASPYYMPEADGVVKRAGRGNTADLVAFSRDDSAQNQLVLAGCDPATGLLSRMVEKISGVEVVSAAASSKLALAWLKKGKVHIAGSHLEDAGTGEFNLPYIRREFPGAEMTVVTFARWEEGFVTAPGNPKRVRQIEDLVRKNIRFVNREVGSGSRALLDKLLDKAGIDGKKIPGYNRPVPGHLAAAYRIAGGEADVCLATRSAARAFNLDFVPLYSERYDLVMRKQTAGLPAAQAFLDVLNRSALRRKLEALAGYDTLQTGSVVA